VKETKYEKVDLQITAVDNANRALQSLCATSNGFDYDKQIRELTSFILAECRKMRDYQTDEERHMDYLRWKAEDEGHINKVDKETENEKAKNYEAMEHINKEVKEAEEDPQTFFFDHQERLKNIIDEVPRGAKFEAIKVGEYIDKIDDNYVGLKKQLWESYQEYKNQRDEEINELLKSREAGRKIKVGWNGLIKWYDI